MSRTFVLLAALTACAVALCADCRNPPVLYTADFHHTVDAIKARIQAPAPEFSAAAVVNGEIAKISLSDFKGKYVVLVFFPLAWTFVCPTELIAFNERLQEFRSLNTEVIAISVDSEYSLLAWTEHRRSEGGLGKMDLPLASDLTQQISRDYGVVLKDAGHSLRGLFIIDDKGVLRQITMNDLPVGRDVDETLRLVKAFQHTDANGVVCPANWQPGDDTIIPDPKDKLDYFRKTRD